MSEELKTSLVIDDQMTPALKEAQSAVVALQGVGDGLNASVGNLGASFNATKGIADKLKASVQGLTGGFQQFGGAAKGNGNEAKAGFLEAFAGVELLKTGLEVLKSGFELAWEGAKKLYDIISESVKKGAEMQSLAQVFQMKGGEKGVAILEQTKDFLEGVGINGDDAFDVLKKLGTAFDPKSAQELARVVADVKGNMPTADIKAVSDELVKLSFKAQVGQKDVKALGASMGHELPLDAIAKATGKSLAEVTAELKNSTLPAQDLVKGLREAQFAAAGVQHSGEAAAKGLATNFEAQKNRIDNSLDNVKEMLASAFTSPEAIAAVKNLADKVNELVSNPEFKKFIEDASAALMKLAKLGIDGVIVGLHAIQSVAETVTNAWKRLNDGSSEMNELLIALKGVGMTLVIGGLGLIAALAIAAAVAFVALALPIIVAVAAFVAVGVAIYEVIQHWSDFTGWLGKVGGSITSFVTESWNSLIGFADRFADLGKNMVMGLVQGITSLASAPVDAIMGVGQKAIDGFKSLLGIHSPSKVMMEMGVNTSQGFADGIDDGGSKVARSSADVASVPAESAAMASAPALAARDTSSPSSEGTAGGSSGRAISITFGDINVGGHSAGQDAGAQAQDIIVEVERRLYEVFSGGLLQGA